MMRVLDGALRGLRNVGTVCAVLGMAACQTTPGTPGRPDLAIEYHIGASDTLGITVRPEPIIARTVVVRPDGRISFDLIGDLFVVGQTVEQVRAAFSERLREYIVHPEVTITLDQSNSRLFYVFGEVRRPGAFPLTGNVDVLGAFATAGGGSDFASLNRALLVRPTAEQDLRYPVFLASIVKEGKAATNYQLQPGDVLYIPPTIFGQVGYAVQHFFFPLQSVLGIGGRLIRGGL